MKKEHERVLDTKFLILYGLGTTIGSGIFVITGEAAVYAGPALFISYLLTGLVCYPTAMAYAELSSKIPLKGSSYSYVYCSYGELAAFLIGWAYILR